MIGEYDIYSWILFFYTYSIFGWVFESAYVSIRSKKWVDRGFLRGPFLPIYGSGAVMMLFVSAPFKENVILVYFAGVVGATLLELVTGVVMEVIFKVRYWDYSNQKFNYKGYICLSSSVAWGFFTVGMNLFLHPFVEAVLNLIPMLIQQILMGAASVALAVDFVISTREAFSLRNILISMEEVRKEMVLLRRRADVVAACADDSWRTFVDAHPNVERLEEIAKGMELRFAKLRQEFLPTNRLTPTQLEELTELKERFKKIVEKNGSMQKKGKKTFRHRILGNPSMISQKYKYVLESLKESVKNK